MANKHYADVETEFENRSFHRMPSERRRKLWSLAARAAVKCPDDIDKESGQLAGLTGTKESESLAITQDSGVSVDLNSEAAPFSSRCSSFMSTSNQRISLDTDPLYGKPVLGSHHRMSHGGGGGKCTLDGCLTLSTDLADVTDQTHTKLHTPKRRSLVPNPSHSGRFSSVDAKFILGHNPSLQTGSVPHRDSADTSGIGSSLDWASIEAGLQPSRYKSASHILNSLERPSLTIPNVPAYSLDETEATPSSRRLASYRHMTSHSTDYPHYPLTLIDETHKPGHLSKRPNPDEADLARRPGSSKGSQELRVPSSRTDTRKRSRPINAVVSISAPCSPMQTTKDEKILDLLRNPYTITRSFDHTDAQSATYKWRTYHPVLVQSANSQPLDNPRHVPEIGFSGAMCSYVPNPSRRFQDYGQHPHQPYYYQTHHLPPSYHYQHPHYQYPQMLPPTPENQPLESSNLPTLHQRSVHWAPIGYDLKHRVYLDHYARTMRRRMATSSFYRRSRTLDEPPTAHEPYYDYYGYDDARHSKTLLYPVPPPTNDNDDDVEHEEVEQPPPQQQDVAGLSNYRLKRRYSNRLESDQLGSTHLVLVDYPPQKDLAGYYGFERQHLGQPETAKMGRDIQQRPSYYGRRFTDIPELRITPVHVGQTRHEGPVQDYPAEEYHLLGLDHLHHDRAHWVPEHHRKSAPQIRPIRYKRPFPEPTATQNPTTLRDLGDQGYHHPEKLRYLSKRVMSLDRPHPDDYDLNPPTGHPAQSSHTQEMQDLTQLRIWRQRRLKERLPFFHSDSLDYPVSSSSKSRPLIHPAYVDKVGSAVEPDLKDEKAEAEIEQEEEEEETDNQVVLGSAMRGQGSKSQTPSKTDTGPVREHLKDMSYVSSENLPPQRSLDDNNGDDDDGVDLHDEEDQDRADRHCQDLDKHHTSRTPHHSHRHPDPDSLSPLVRSPNHSLNEIVPLDNFVRREVRISEPLEMSHKKYSQITGDSALKQPLMGNQASSMKVSVTLPGSEFQEFAEYWDHSLFSGARIVAVCLAGVASLCLISSICANTWVYQGFANNLTYSGFWKRCSYLNQTCENLLPFFNKHNGWQDGALCILVLAILLGLLGMSLAVAGHLVYALPKRLYYFHSGGEAHVVAAFVTALSLLIYHITVRMHLRFDGPVSFGEAYGISWFACILHLMTALLLLLDELIHELANISTRVACVRSCLYCAIRTYNSTHKRYRAFTTKRQSHARKY